MDHKVGRYTFEDVDEQVLWKEGIDVGEQGLDRVDFWVHDNR